MLSLEINNIVYLVVSGKSFFNLKKMLFGYTHTSGCARWGASGALFPKSALCGAEFPLKGLIWDSVLHFDRPPRNRRLRTSSGPEGSSDK